jgi:hypothetical protein
MFLTDSTEDRVRANGIIGVELYIKEFLTRDCVSMKRGSGSRHVRPGDQRTAGSICLIIGRDVLDFVLFGELRMSDGQTCRDNKYTYADVQTEKVHESP